MKKEKKIEPMEALAKIKILIKKYYEQIGREDYTNSEEMKMELIDDIEEIIDKVDIPTKNLIIEDLETNNINTEKWK